MSKLDEIIKKVNSKTTTPIMTIGLPDYDYVRVPFSSMRMNLCTYGGLPMGKLVEFFGDNHSGKTTSALDIIANFQQYGDGRSVLYIDAENTLDTLWAKKLGVNTDELILLQPQSQSAEDIFNIILEAIDTGEVGMFVLDSIGVLVSAEELGKDVGDKTYAGISKSLTSFSKRVEMLLQKHKALGICINQVRDNLNSMWGGVTTVGGKGFKHCCTVRLQFSKGSYIDSNGKELSSNAENPVGNIVKMSMIKNKSCPSDRRLGFYTINYMTGIDKIGDLIEVGLYTNVIEQKGAWFKVINPETEEVVYDKLQGKTVIRNLLSDDKVYNEVQQYIESQI